jgi:putative tricarboxylic transport membrane protein
MQRRQILEAGAAVAGLWATGASAQQPPKRDTLPELRIVIPANPGGGWDQTGRALGTALQTTKLVERVQYENIGGKAGTIGLAQFVDRYPNAPNTLMVGGMVMLGGIAMQRPAVDLSHVNPIAALTSEYMIVAVPAASPIKSVKDLAARLASPEFKAVAVGGSAGGVDHMLLGMMVRTARGKPDNFTYLATSSGGDAMRALTDGKAQIGISGYSEFRSAIEAGTIRPLAISSRRGRFGLPTLREGGIDTEMANWRGVFAPSGISAAQSSALAALVESAAKSPECSTWFDAMTGKPPTRAALTSATLSKPRKPWHAWWCTFSSSRRRQRLSGMRVRHKVSLAWCSLTRRNPFTCGQAGGALYFPTRCTHRRAQVLRRAAKLGIAGRRVWSWCRSQSCAKLVDVCRREEHTLAAKLPVTLGARSTGSERAGRHHRARR